MNLITTKEAAEELGLDPSTVKSLLRRGLIRGARKEPSPRRHGFVWLIPSPVERIPARPGPSLSDVSGPSHKRTPAEAREQFGRGRTRRNPEGAKGQRICNLCDAKGGQDWMNRHLAECWPQD